MQEKNYTSVGNKGGQRDVKEDEGKEKDGCQCQVFSGL